jgi:hypothetical protein
LTTSEPVGVVDILSSVDYNTAFTAPASVAFFAVAVVALVSSVKVTIMPHPEPKGLKEDSLKVIFHKPDTIKTSQVDEYSSSECHYDHDNHYGNCIHCNQ